MHLPRRRFLQTLAAAAAVPSAWSVSNAAGPLPVEILDTHQHLWDLNKFQMAWLSGAPEVLRKSYGLKEYAEATRGLPVRALYMEVDVAEADLDSEASEARRIGQEGNSQTLAASVGGRPASDKFEDYLKRHGEGGVVKGVRQVLHPADLPRGFCLEEPFVRGIRVLGKLGLTFDLCIRVGELGDAERLAAQCPETHFILDHCGNVDSKAFMKAPPKAPAHAAADWQRAVERMAKLPNVACKISGVIESLPDGWTPEQLAPAVNHCLDVFGPDRVVFGANWPVCLIGGSLRSWVEALSEILAPRPEADRAKLWASNAKRLYRVG